MSFINESTDRKNSVLTNRGHDPSSRCGLKSWVQMQMNEPSCSRRHPASMPHLADWQSGAPFISSPSSQFTKKQFVVKWDLVRDWSRVTHGGARYRSASASNKSLRRRGEHALCAPLRWKFRAQQQAHVEWCANFWFGEIQFLCFTLSEYQ